MIRNVIKGVVQAVADARHRTDGGDGDESGDEAIFDGGRTVLVPDQLEKLAHGLAPGSAGQQSRTAVRSGTIGFKGALIEKWLRNAVTAPLAAGCCSTLVSKAGAK